MQNSAYCQFLRVNEYVIWTIPLYTRKIQGSVNANGLNCAHKVISTKKPESNFRSGNCVCKLMRLNGKYSSDSRGASYSYFSKIEIWRADNRKHRHIQFCSTTDTHTHVI